MNKITEKSVEEIVEEFGRFTIMDENYIYLHGNARVAKDWLTQTLQAERQKREEVVEAERERIVNIVEKWMETSNPAYAQDLFEALTHPNNPK